MFRRDTRPPSFYGTVLPPPDEWNVVIKAKYGDILKRLNGFVTASHFSHDFAFLLSTLRTVYKFGPQDQLVLSYTDEDGDVVMLDGDGDLSDAVICQKLNPLRINVQLKSTPQAKQRSSNSRSPKPSVLEDDVALVKAVIGGSLKIAPDDLAFILTELSSVLRCQSASSLADLLDQIAKRMTPESGMQPFNGHADGSSISSSTESSVSTIGHVDPSLRLATGYELKRHMPFGCNEKISDDLLFPPTPTHESIRKINYAMHSTFPPVEGFPYHMAPTFESDGMIKSQLQSTLARISPCGQTIPTSGSNGNINDGLQTALHPSGYSPFNFSSMPSVFGSYAHEEGYSFPHAYIDARSMSGSVPEHTLHGRIKCDSCGLFPITWPLVKSNAKQDYNLCAICLLHLGDEHLSARIDKSLSLEERIIGSDKGRRLQPDCSFTTDATIPSGTSMPPSTPFIQVVQPAQTSDCKQSSAMKLNSPIDDDTRKRNLTDLTDRYLGDVRYMYTRASPPPEDIKAKESKPSQNATPCTPAGELVQASINDPHITSSGAVVTTPAGSPAPETTPLPPAPVAGPDEISNSVVDKMLEELEAMGFSEVDLNREILRLNEYDLQKSVDDLRMFQEWDPIAELQEILLSPGWYELNDMEAREVV